MTAVAVADPTKILDARDVHYEVMVIGAYACTYLILKPIDFLFVVIADTQFYYLKLKCNVACIYAGYYMATAV